MRKRFFLNCLLILALVVIMSTSAFAISESDVESAVSTSGKEAVSGNVLVWFLCAIAFLKVSQKIDSFLSSLGLNVGHTGGSMLSEAMIAMRAINTATSAVGSALGSHSRHGSAPASGKPGGGSAAAAGFFSGGLVGMASRKIASDAVRTATAEKNIVQPQQAEATVSRTHASSDTHSGSQSASEQQRQNTSQLDQNQQVVSSRAVNSEQRENSQQALHESQHSVDTSQIHQDTQTAQEQQFHAALHTEDQQASHLAFQSEQGEFVGSVVQSDEFDASSEEARTEQSQVMQSALQQEQIGVTQREVQSEESHHAQHDNIGGYGCGPTCMAMVVSSLTDDLVDPVEMAKWSYEHGYWCSGSGSYHALIPAAAEAWGLPVSGCTASEPQRITDALSSGKLVVAIMSAGHFTSSGHFIVLRGVKDEKILVADPASRTRSEQSWELSIILNEASKAAGSGGPFWIIG